ncbi:DinB family protein [Flavobacterium aestivum]|uniref:DinB family protein n=1 Tax=Flavobacterium aestivum TaxID=3003257 RepID=UPI0022855C4E|nr:DinB family protein [Flavobacterium aestivum]
MTQNEIIILNFEEIRRRSIKLWNGITPENYFWKPDNTAMNCLEMVRHVLEGEHLFHMIVNKRGNLGDYVSPWENRPYTDLQAELDFAEPFRVEFLDTIKKFDDNDFSTIEIIRSEKGQRRKLGDYLQRIAYHEAVHTGQMLSYLRTIGIERPQIWD